MILTADTVVTGSELLRPGWIEIKDGRVMQTGAGASPQAVDVALGAVTVVPGFVDMHTHGGGGGAFPEATAEASEAAVALHRRHGSRLLGLHLARRRNAGKPAPQPARRKRTAVAAR